MVESSAPPEDAPLVTLRRGTVVESVHRGRWVFCDPEGQVLDAAGNAEGSVCARSSAKPFQALPLVLSGAAGAFGLGEAELAIACASHNGEEEHLAAVRSLLKKAGLSERDLQNGPHPPLHEPAARALLRRGFSPRRVHGNCSGKHAGMLAVCAREGWDKESYRRPHHPLQCWILDLLAAVCGVSRGEVSVAGDDCGVPTFSLPLRGLATGFARLATGKRLPDDVAAAAREVRDAMRKRPFLVAGTGRFDTSVMRGTELVCKSGAEAVFCVGSPDGWGLALKISDGAARAVPPAALETLSQRGVNVPGEPASRTLSDLHGAVIGELGPVS